MPITTRHPEYEDWIKDWELCSTFASGPRAVKKAGKTYLPHPDGMNNDEYEAYKDRASFLNAMGRTVAGLSGAMTRVPAVESFSTAMDYLSTNCTGAGHTFQQFIVQTYREVLTTNRMGVFIDADASGKPRLIPYQCESITNWDEENGEPTRVVLKSVSYENDPKDEYVKHTVVIYLELMLQDGEYVYRYWRPENITAREPVYKPGPIERPLTTRGQPLTKIPFKFLSSQGIDVSPSKPVLLDLCYLNRAHYLNSADLEHGRYWVSLPTPWVSGVDPDDYKRGGGLKVGSTTAWILSNPDSKVGMLEFTGRGLGHLADAIDEKQQQMALMGAKLLQPHRKQVESAELARMANAGDASILMSIASAVESGLNAALEVAAEIYSVPTPQTVKLNRDFVDIKLDPKEMEILLAYYQQGIYSEEEFLDQLMLGERFKGDKEQAAGRIRSARKELMLSNQTEREEQDGN